MYLYFQAEKYREQIAGLHSLPLTTFTINPFSELSIVLYFRNENFGDSRSQCYMLKQICK